MIAAGIALVVIGVIFFFIFPWVGIAAGAVGIILVALFLAGVGRRVAKGRPAEPS
jgi:hypothetical protein